MKSKQLLVSRSERGMTTAEYALGTIAVVALVGVVIGIFTEGAVTEQIINVIRTIIQWLIDFISER